MDLNNKKCFLDFLKVARYSLLLELEKSKHFCKNHKHMNDKKAGLCRKYILYIFLDKQDKTIENRKINKNLFHKLEFL